MDFKIGYNVKPKQITTLSEVIFEEYQLVSGRYELVEVAPTEDECKGYGFNYIDSKCWITAKKTDLKKIDNVIEAGSSNIKRTGANRCLITGKNNAINEYVTSSIVSGTKGEVVYHNSKVLGGNDISDELGERQAVQVMAAAATTDATPTISYLNNDGATMIKVPENTIISFSADVLAVRTGGTGSGDKGDFRKWHEEGAVVNIGGTLTIERIKTLKVSSGTVSGWSIEAKTTGEYLYLELVGRNNRDLKWAIQWNLTEIKTGVDLSA
jgi:hypothetical protein